MERISSNFGASSRNFFVLSNGIFTTGEGGPERYAKVEFIPLKGGQMEKIVEINRLSRDIEAGKYTLAEARTRIESIRNMPAKPHWEQILGSAFGSAGFCVLFGGGLSDALSSFVTGFLLWIFVLLISRPGFSKVLVNILGLRDPALHRLPPHRFRPESGKYNDWSPYSADPGSSFHKRHQGHSQ